MTTLVKLSRLALALVAIGAGACAFDIANPNSPDVIGENPNRSQVAAAATGILIATRADVADWALDGGIFGREAYRFDGSDPRFTGEMMQGPLDPGSRAVRRGPLGRGVRRHPERQRPARASSAPRARSPPRSRAR